MHSTTTTSTAVSAATFRPPLPQQSSPNPTPNSIQFKPNPHSISINSNKKQITVTPPAPPSPYFRAKHSVAEKVNILVSEFKSLPEPIDRVKRLLHYASLLPDPDESEKSLRSESNRVTGCTAQVWVEAAVMVGGRIRFRVDSDSEITKGFCYCLIWLLDGEKGEEVIRVNVEVLQEMNVGILPVRVSSRINTWHHVLLAMQNKTKTLLNLKQITSIL